MGNPMKCVKRRSNAGSMCSRRLVMATTTPDQTFPATASAVQAKLGVAKGAAFDIQAVCSGFVFGLATADSFLKQGMFKKKKAPSARSALLSGR